MEVHFCFMFCVSGKRRAWYLYWKMCLMILHALHLDMVTLAMALMIGVATAVANGKWGGAG